MQNVGEKLKKARLDKKLSLKQVYQQTKIQPQILEALEEGKPYEPLSPVYFKSFLKAYANYLKLDGDKLLREYSHGQKPRTPQEEVVLEKRHKDKVTEDHNPMLIIRAISAVVLVIFLIFYFRFAANKIKQSTLEAKNQKVKIRVLPTGELKPDDFNLEVKALSDCWMRVSADGEELFQGTLAKGKKEKWQAKNRIELRIGKPEALEVRLNGKVIDLKKIKVKKKLIITHQGVVGK